MWKKFKRLAFILLIIIFLASASPIDWFFSLASAAQGEAPLLINKYYNLDINQATTLKGYTVGAFGRLKLSLVPGILSQATAVEIIELHEKLPLPWPLSLISNIYQFEFKNKAAYDEHKPFYIQFAYEEENSDYKQVYFYDKNFNGWRPLPTRDFPNEKFVRSLIHLPFARIAVFSYPGKMTVGQASWYAHKTGNFTASPDFPKGSRLRVTNQENGKFVDVVVNDYGPDRKVFPKRALDLEKTAFSGLARLSEGTIEIKIEPLYIAPDNTGRILGVSEMGVNTEPEISSRAAIVMDEASGKIIWQKNATGSRPLASLTKLVAIKVFLDTRPTLNRVVQYMEQDELYNYEHVNKWESAKLTITEGETLTIEDLVYSALVGSANNAVESLVRVSGLERNAFIARMNSEVVRWGASSTHFIEPTGLAPENVSSALDYAIISREVLKNPIIVKASTMPEYKFTTINSKKAHRIRNTDYILRTNNYNITGSKTGYLDEAMYCLMVRAKKAGKSVIVVTMGADTRDISFVETSRLLDYGLR